MKIIIREFKLKVVMAVILFSIFWGSSASAEIPRKSFPTGTWQGDFFIEEVKSFHDGYGNTVLVAKVTGVNGLLSTGCPNTDKLGLIAYWSGGHMNSSAQAFLSTMLTAKAQSLAVELLLSGQCNDSHGSRFEGINIL